MFGRNRVRKLRVESLEAKTLLASDFAVDLIGGDLFITNVVNDIDQIGLGITTPTGTDDLLLVPIGDVTLNGVAGDLTFADFAGNITIDFGPPAASLPVPGASLQVIDATLPGDLTVLGGNTLDSVSISTDVAPVLTSIAGDLTLEASGDVGSLEIIDANVGGDVRFTATGLGFQFVTPMVNTLLLENVTIGDDLIVNGGEGTEMILADTLDVGDDVRIDLGGGDDTVQIAQSTVVDNFGAVTRAGFDTVTITDSSIGDDLRLRTGADDDNVTLLAVDVLDNARLNLGGGDDFILVDVLNVTDTTLLQLGGGEDEASLDMIDAGLSFTATGRGTNAIDIEGLTAEFFVTVVTANGNDQIGLDTVTTQSVLVSTGAGNDTVDIFFSTFDRLILFAGAGDDLVMIDETTVNRWALLSGGPGDDTLDFGTGANDINLLIDFGFEAFLDDMV